MTHSAAAATVEERLAKLEAAQPAINSGDNAWLLTSSALVLMMTAPGLALFYGGLVRTKNVLATMMHSMFLMGFMSLLWMLYGYSMAFGEGNAFFGNPMQYFMLRGVGGAPNMDYASTVPHQSFMLFQLMFAIITPALISGAFAERMRFSAFVLFTVLWATFIYFPLAHMVWGKGGYFNWALGGQIPVLDFAGGTVVHISSGTSALVCALVLGRRVGYPHEPMPPHNVVLSLIGTGLLWVGWFGFNAGSALGSSELATRAFAATHFSAAAAALSWGARNGCSKANRAFWVSLRGWWRPGHDHAGFRFCERAFGGPDRPGGRDGLLSRRCPSSKRPSAMTIRSTCLECMGPAARWDALVRLVGQRRSQSPVGFQLQS